MPKLFLGDGRVIKYVSPDDLLTDSSIKLSARVQLYGDLVKNSLGIRNDYRIIYNVY